MAHIFLQQDPKVSVGNANDNPATIPTPQELGSLLVTYAATGPTGQLADAYAALDVSGTPQWVQIGAIGATGSTGATGATGVQGPYSFTQFTGAGPFAMSSTPTDTIGVNPTGDAVLNLPALAGVLDGTRVDIEHNGPTTTSSVIILPNGADVIGNAAIFSRLFFGGSVQLQANVATGRWELLEYASGVPTSPEYFVSSAGSDAQPGTVAAPLATPQEATRRLRESKWLTEAFVTTVNTINLGASPTLDVPAPTGSARPICFRTTYTNLLTGVLATGGTQGQTAARSTLIGGTITSAAAGAVDVYKGQILVPTSGGNVGMAAIIHSNDGAGGFTTSAFLPALPAGSTFDVRSRVGKWTWSGRFSVLNEAAFIFDGMEFLPTGTSSYAPIGGYIQENGTRWLTAASGFTPYGTNCEIQCGPQSYFAPTAAQRFNPTGLVPCGCRFDYTLSGAPLGCLWGGDAGALDLSVNFVDCSFENVSFFPGGFGGNARVSLVRTTLLNSGAFAWLCPTSPS